MSKNEETNMLIECVTKLKGKGMAIDNTVFLADIAKSLAMIADKLYMEESKVCKVESSVDVLDKIRAEIAEYGSICVAYAITDKTKTDEGIEELVTDVLSEAKRQVLGIIDKYKASPTGAESEE